MTALRFRLTNFLLLLILLALMAVIAMLATDARGGPLDPPGGSPASTDSVRLPGTPINGPTTISAPGHYYLTRDIALAGAGVAITISADNVSLDLGGFTVDGNDTLGSYGIHITALHDDIAISNGTVRDFQYGVDTGNGQRVRIENIHANSNRRGFHLGHLNVLTRCSALINEEIGIYVPAQLTQVQDCTANSNGEGGIAVNGTFNIIERNESLGNGIAGIRDIGVSTNMRNMFRENTSQSISLMLNGGAIVVDNLCLSVIVNTGGNTIGSPDHLNFGC